MVYGIISDIHSNLTAFEVALVGLGRERVDRIVCLGDVVGYGAYPNECIEIVREKGILSILGNHEAGIIGILKEGWFSSYARICIEWTKRVLKNKNFMFLKNMQGYIRSGDLHFSHACFSSPEEFRYLLRENDSYYDFAHMEHSGCRINFIGHTHIPGIFERDGQKITFVRENPFRFKDGCWYIVNVGSVGQPRDGDPRVCYCIYNEDNSVVEFKRERYDIASAQLAIRRVMLPEYLADRLSRGR